MYRVAETIPEHISRELGEYPALTRQLLFSRGITSKKEAEIFLYPDYDRDILDPFGILNMEKAVSRIRQAVDAGEKIVIYGDYDCDGIPGTTLLYEFFKKIRYPNISVYIPHRHKEGYGLNERAIEKFIKEGVKLLITVDCGITNVKEVEVAEKNGVHVIVTDHHLPQEIIPPAFAVINSKQKEEQYQEKMLCGAGVAWKLVTALLKTGAYDVPPGWEKWLLELAGLSTIADMVPLRGENRAIAHFGLFVMRKTRRTGLLSLFEHAGISRENITEDDVGFTIGPRINAASRLDEPIRAFKLLSAETREEAEEHAAYLESVNTDRKWIVAQAVKEAKKELREREIRDVIVIGNPKWNVGILGIIASNLMEEYERPAFVWGREGSENIKGSVRSDGSVNVLDLMTRVPTGTFLDVGGHELSGGFSMEHTHIHFLEERLLSAYEHVRREKKKQEFLVDMTLSIDDIEDALFKELRLLAPFGIENPKPLFLFERVPVKNRSFFGKQKEHLKLILSQSNGKTISAISFFAEESIREKTEEKEHISFLAHAEESFFRNKRELRLRIVAIL